MYEISSVISGSAGAPVRTDKMLFTQNPAPGPKRNEAFSQKKVSGDHVFLSATHSAHYGLPETAVQKDDFVSDFATALKRAFDSVNRLQAESDQLTKALAVNPDSVDVHDVTIAAEKARLAVLFTKSIVDKITQSYRELINMR